MMQIEIQYVEDCPHSQELIELVQQLGEGRDDLTLRTVLVDDSLPVPRDFAGSPTVLIDGRDIAGGVPVTTAACALHPPSADQVRSAIQAP